METEINKTDIRVIILSLIITIGGIGIMYLFVNEMIWYLEMPLIPRIIITVMGLKFLFKDIIVPISEWTLKIIQGLSNGLSLMNAIDETIPKENNRWFECGQ